MSDLYLAHSGRSGQKWGMRNYQSYSVAPTRSGMVGEERGEAAEQRARIASGEDYENDPRYKKLIKKERDRKIRAAKKQIKADRKAEKLKSKEEKKQIEEQKRSTKTREEAEKDKQKVLKSGDPDKILRFNKYHPEMISNQELEDAINRIRKEETLQEMYKKRQPQIKTGREKLDELSKALGTAANIADKTASIVNAGSRIYETINGKPDPHAGKTKHRYRKTTIKNEGGYTTTINDDWEKWI